ncbi:ferrous iron transport protein A [Streptomyces sp. NPDC001941]|uniref:ferrous iron transport protein A n=1 Tax=Streptomyces sp. NPDC001941 TaxID=3154659 RepID=UPI00333226C6
MSLRSQGPGAHVRVVRVGVGAHDRLRLAELGFVRGARITVLGRGATGGLRIALGDARLAIDDDTADAVDVVPLAPGCAHVSNGGAHA